MFPIITGGVGGCDDSCGNLSMDVSNMMTSYKSPMRRV